MLTQQVQDLRGVVEFGSMCTVYRDPKKSSLDDRAQVGMIVGRSDETKGYRVYNCKNNVVGVTQHVKNIHTLSDLQNEQLRIRLQRGDQDGTFKQIRKSLKKTLVMVKTRKMARASSRSERETPYSTLGSTKQSKIRRNVCED